MAEGYLDGQIARTLDDVAARWEAMCATLPPSPGQRPTAVCGSQLVARPAR